MPRGPSSSVKIKDKAESAVLLGRARLPCDNQDAILTLDPGSSILIISLPEKGKSRLTCQAQVTECAATATRSYGQVRG